MNEENTTTISATESTTESSKVRKSHISVTVDPVALVALREHCSENKLSLSRGVELAIQKFVESL